MAWYQSINNDRLNDAGLEMGLSLGRVIEIRQYGDIAVVEHDWSGVANHQDDYDCGYSVYLDGKYMAVSGSSWDHALLVAMGRKYEGRNKCFVFAEYASRMLGIEESQ
jgi:hypothetical protein